MYLYFTDKDQKTLPSQFWYNVGMQNLSQKEAVFVLVKVSKKPTDEEKELLKKYRVTKLKTAVLADHNGNPLAHAERKNSTTLLKQIRKARILIEKIDKDLSTRMEKATAAYEKGNTNTAKIIFQAIIRTYPAYDQATEAAEYVAKIEAADKAKKEALEKAKAE